MVQGRGFTAADENFLKLLRDRTICLIRSWLGDYREDFSEPSSSRPAYGCDDLNICSPSSRLQPTCAYSRSCDAHLGHLSILAAVRCKFEQQYFIAFDIFGIHSCPTDDYFDCDIAIFCVHTKIFSPNSREWTIHAGTAFFDLVPAKPIMDTVIAIFPSILALWFSFPAIHTL